MKTILLDTSIDYTSWDISETGSIEMTDWQPIETAPKDIGAIIGSNGQWVLAMRWATNGMTWTSEYHRSAVVPTHWMPLPNPPKEKT